MRLDAIKFCVLMILVSITNVIKAQNSISVEDDFVASSLVITSVGKHPYQITGHAAIRMRCDSLGLDKVFTFENNAGNNLKKLYYDGALGRLFEVEYEDYTQYIKDEGRELISLSLNLNLEENVRLWEVLDSVKLLPDRPFNITDSHCFSICAEILEESLAPSKINFNAVALEWDSYSQIAYHSGGNDNPWNYLLMMLALGSKADQNGVGGKFIYPTIIPPVYNKFRVYSSDGSWKPLFSNIPQVIIPATGTDKPNRPTPVTFSIIILGMVLIVTIYQVSGKLEIVGKILDGLVWVIVTGGGIFIAFITYMPHHYGSYWNWPLLVLNPIAWLPVVLLRRNRQALAVVWGIYAFILIVFAIFIGFVAPSIDAMWRILAVALAIRCLWHVADITYFASRD